LGEVCLKNRKPEKTVQAFKNAKTIDPGKSEAFLRLGNILNVMGENDEAAENFEKAFLMDKASPSAFRRLTMIKTVELSSEIAKEAKNRLESGLESKGDQAHIHYGFAYIHEKLGNKKKTFKKKAPHRGRGFLSKMPRK
jgi:Tfp pilus assembly protein PilF